MICLVWTHGTLFYCLKLVNSAKPSGPWGGAHLRLCSLWAWGAITIAIVHAESSTMNPRLTSQASLVLIYRPRKDEGLSEHMTYPDPYSNQGRRHSSQVSWPLHRHGHCSIVIVNIYPLYGSQCKEFVNLKNCMPQHATEEASPSANVKR